MKNRDSSEGILRSAVPDQASSTIRYEGAKETRVPMPIVVIGLLAIGAALFAARHLLGL